MRAFLLPYLFGRNRKMNKTFAQAETHPIFQELNPSLKQFLKARFLSPRLNPFAHHLITVAALTTHGLPHIKAVPAHQMMLEDLVAGRYKGKHTIVIDSSGNTAHAVVRLASAFGFSDVKVVISSDVPNSKKGILAALSSVEIIEVSGGKSVAKRAIEEAQKPGHYHLNQYSHEGNVHAHELYTGPEVLRALDDNVGIIAIAMGSGGTALGVGRFLKSIHPETIVIGVCPKLGEQVPGARDRKRMSEVVTFPWEDTVDAVFEVSRKKAFEWTRRLWSEVEPQPGPTSGLAFKGLMQYLRSLDAKELKKLRGKNAAFICADDGRFYSDLMIAELDTGQGLR